MNSTRTQSNGKWLLFLKSSFLFCLFFIANSIGAKSSNLPELSGDNVISHGSQYSILYDQLLDLEKQGKRLEALRLIPKIYAAEDIPVDDFFLTLDKKRQDLLDEVVRKNLSFSIGKKDATCAVTLRIFMDHYIGKKQSYKYIVQIADDLEYDRFCYLLITQGYLQQTSYKGSLILPSTSRFRLQSALDSSDPWLVSAAIFFARKQKKPTISLQAIINRWEKRPDLWDERCTQQTLLFLAQLDTKVVSKLQVSNVDIQRQLAELQAVPSDKSYISPLLFSAIGNRSFSYKKPKMIKLVRLEANAEKVGVVKRWVGDKNEFSNLEPVAEQEVTADDYEHGAISVKPGSYKIQYNSVSGMPPTGYYGDSSIFKIESGKLMVIPVSLYPAI